MIWAELQFDNGKLPAWMRTAGIDEKGRIWVPSILGFKNENVAILCLAHDGAEFHKYKGHFFVNTEWLKQECPEVADVCSTIERRLREIGALS